jgi:cysteine sulfinate desulfinase/cysteine desulfurase-like protein
MNDVYFQKLIAFQSGNLPARKSMTKEWPTILRQTWPELEPVKLEVATEAFDMGYLTPSEQFRYQADAEPIVAAALELAQKESAKESKRLAALRDYMIKKVLKEIPRSYLNGHPTQRLPNNASFTILDVEGESMILRLSEKGICASTGSACTSRSLEPSHVLQAIGLPKEVAHGSLRFSLGKSTTKADVDYAVKELKKVVEGLREISPIKINEKVMRGR